ncbi:MAG: beta-N-acetylhexosaminidase [Clostridia bacterium]|nr:beta-N-acetylhexosaminidase [Clostridia bacterium]
MKFALTDLSFVEGLEELISEFELDVELVETDYDYLVVVDQGANSIDKVGEECRITYSHKPAFFMMFLKLLQHIEVEEYKISMSYNGDFGVMVDCSRNAVMTLDTAKRTIRNMASMGYTYLELYTEDTYEVEGEPLFGYKRSRYSRDEIIKIVEYAEIFGMEVVPCVQTLAHLNAIFNWPTYQEHKDYDDILLAKDERTYRLIDNIFRSLRSMYKTNRINLGMDEAHMLARGKYMDKHGYVPAFEVFAEHLRYVLEVARSYGFDQPSIWCDMYFRMANEGNYYIKDKSFSFTEEQKATVPQGVKLIYWDYYNVDDDVIDNMIRLVGELSPNTAYAGGLWKWAGYAPANYITQDVDRHIIPRCLRAGMTDVLMTAWGDCGAEASIFSILPGMLYTSEMLYTGGVREINSRCMMLFGYTYRDMVKLDLPNILEDNHKHEFDIQNPSKYLLYNDLLLGIMDPYMPDDVEDRYSKMHRTLSRVEGGSKYQYIFDTMIALTKLLSIKASLGREIRATYLAGGDMTPLLDKITKARKALRNFKLKAEQMWFREYKPVGYEVLDVRLGGLDNRMATAYNRIQMYISGEIPTIEELDEPVLDYLGKAGKPVVNNVWGTIFTACPTR